MNVNHPTNGSSLEDCFTNFIALADLSNIKWRGLEFNGSPTSDPLDCPVLSSYGKCLARDLLCVWRRVVNNRCGPIGNDSTPQQKTYSKELWCFWFDAEPDWKSLLHHDLTEIYQGTWEHGLSYECRTLLFKSFHNLIEKSLLSKGYALLGKNFVQPCDIRLPVENENGAKCFSSTTSSFGESSNYSFESDASSHNVYTAAASSSSPFGHTSSSSQLAFTVNFFIHGESIVCANVDVRQKPAIYRLSRFHLANAHNLQTSINIILSPYGLKGTLSGQSFKDTDPAVQKMLNDWRKFYPLSDITKDKHASSKGASSTTGSHWNAASFPPESIDGFCSWIGQQSNSFQQSMSGNCGSSNHLQQMPPAVEVIVAGVKMKYPSNFVFLVGDEAYPVSHHHQQSQTNTSANATQLIANTLKANRYSNVSNSASTSSITTKEWTAAPLEVIDPLQQSAQIPRISPRQPQLPTLSYCIRNTVSQEIYYHHSHPQYPYILQEHTSVASDVIENCEDMTAAFSTWEISDLSCRVGCVCFRCKASKSKGKLCPTSGNGSTTTVGPIANLTPSTGTSSSSSSVNSPPKKEKVSEKENKYGGKLSKQSSHGIPFHRRYQSVEITESFKSTFDIFDCPARPSKATLHKAKDCVKSNSNQTALNTTTGVQTAQSTESPKVLTNGDTSSIAPLSASMSAIDSDRPSESPAINFGIGSVGTAVETPATNGNDKPQMDSDMFSPMSAGRHSISSPSSIQWTPNATDTATTTTNVGISATSEGLEEEANEKLQSSSTADTVANNDPLQTIQNPRTPTNDSGASGHNLPTTAQQTSASACNGFKMASGLTTGGIKRPLLPIESSLLDDGSACSTGENKSLLYDFTYVTEIHDWEQPRPKNRRMVRGLCTRMDPNVAPLRCSASSINYGCKPSAIDRNDGSDLVSDDDRANKTKGGALVNGDTEMSSVTSPKVLTRERDLAVSYRDLDQIFDSSSGDESNDERNGCRNKTNENNIQSAEDGGGIASTIGANGRSIKNGTSCILNVAELTRMFPTPPSLEPNAAPSPYSNPLTMGECTPGNDDHLHIHHLHSQSYANPLYRQDDRTNAPPITGSSNLTTAYTGSHLMSLSTSTVDSEPNRDTQFNVYCAPLQTKFISSSKYAPLANIPSMSSTQLPSRCNYKPSAISMRSSSTSPASTNAHHLPPPPPLHNNLVHTKSQQQPPSTAVVNATLPAMTIKKEEKTMQKLDYASIGSSNGCVTSVKSETTQTFKHETAQPLPEINSLLVNLVLSDSLLNVFKDHNFDSCPLCVCNMNIKGFDIDVYLPDTLLRNDEPQYKCSCGFSAINNRHLSCFAGLFFEDEQEVTGVCYDPTERRTLRQRALPPSVMELELKLQKLDPQVLELIKAQSAATFSSSSSFFKSFQYDWFDEAIATPVDSDQTDQADESRDKCRQRSLETRERLPVMLNNSDHSRPVSKRVFINGFNALLRSDSSEIAFLALMLGRAWLECWPPKAAVAGYDRLQQVRDRKENCVHEWLFAFGQVPGNSANEVRCLRRLHRLLIEGPLGKCITSATPREMTIGSTSAGSSGSAAVSAVAPLTWKQFYKLSGRNEDQSEPQPIPSLLVAHERDWVALSPFALKYWEKLALEPYSFNRDIAYIVICPDTPHLQQNVKNFFKDLSATYQMLRLGRHRPITRLYPEGVMKIGNSSNKLLDESVDDWFDILEETPLGKKLRLYAQVCRHTVSKDLKGLPLDRSLILDTRDASATTPSSNKNNNNNPNGNNNASSISSSNTTASATFNNGNNTTGNTGNSTLLMNTTVKSPPANNELLNGDSRLEDLTNTDGSNNNSSGTNQIVGSASLLTASLNTTNGPNTLPATATIGGPTPGESNESEDEQRHPHIVVYMVEPFTFTGLDERTYRIACHGLMRSHIQLLQTLPETLQQHVHLQLISLDSIMPTGRDSSDCTRHEQLRSLAFSVFRQCRRVYVQQPLCKSLTGFGPSASLDAFLRLKDPKEVPPPARLFLPPFVLAPLKDKQTELGEMFGDRREQSQVLFASYCLTEDQRFLIVTCSNERGELSDNTVINVAIPDRHRRKDARVIQFALHKMMQFLIGVMSQATQPWRLVLGRVGRVGHGELRAWASLLSRRQLQAYSKQLRDRCRQCALLGNLDTPCILSACLTSLEPDSRLRVFADQFSAGSNPAHTCTLSTPEDASCTHVLVFPTSSTTQSSQGGFQMDPLGTSIAEDDILQALGADAGDDLAVDDIFEWGSPGSPGREHSATQLDSPTGRAGPFDALGSNLKNMDGDLRDEPFQLLQQPLSLGYYVSTAQTGKLPRWFWTACPHLEDNNPSFLKSALLLHTPSVQQMNDDIYNHTRNSHPLDSNLTTDVLRYVLESYNFLSWLALDPSTHDRMSCLPVHIQMLMQLYHTVHALL